jgi:MFS family permease
MAQSSSKPRIYYGWYIVGVSFLIMAIAGGSGATFPLFLVALTDEFGWSQTSLGGTVSAGMIVGGLVTPFWGRWTDRSGARVVVVTAAVVTGLSVFLRAYMTSLAHLYILSAGEETWHRHGDNARRGRTRRFCNASYRKLSH